MTTILVKIYQSHLQDLVSGDDDNDDDFPWPSSHSLFNEIILPQRIPPPFLLDLSPPSSERNKSENEVLYPDKLKNDNVIGELTMERK